jgi:hypothetical protein
MTIHCWSEKYTPRAAKKYSTSVDRLGSRDGIVN